jgi:hypothetical protein
VSATQASLDFDAQPAAPPPADPHLATALKRIQQEHNRRLLSRLLHGPIGSDELEGCRALYGKRGSARLHDVREWIRHGLGYIGDPLPRRCTDVARQLYEWALTEEARALVVADQEANG